MSDHFTPLSLSQLSAWIFDELDHADSLFGLPHEHFFEPRAGQPYRTLKYGHPLDTPFGVAAGPHSQLAQNLVIAWLTGARFMELKTIQTLDELEISKPCIDMEDEGYNCEWSQELKVQQSFEQYLQAWVLIHALHHRLGFPGEPGVVFNASVGYDLKGIQQPNVQWFLNKVRDVSEDLPALIDVVAQRYPAIKDITIPAVLCDSVTLSTMHGCPPDEIEAIASYLIDEGFHTSVKLNPTLLGPEGVRGVLSDLGYADVVVPDLAFGHDLKYADAVPMLRRLLQAARGRGTVFGVKLSNTLEVENHRGVFAEDQAMMYLSGRPLHAITVNVAARLEADLDGGLLMSFSGGADAFNAHAVLATGMRSVTVCSDLLKTGGYLRLKQYMENTEAAMNEVGAADLDHYVVYRAEAREGDALPAKLAAILPLGLDALGVNGLLDAHRAGDLRAFALARGLDPADAVLALRKACARLNLQDYAAHVVAEPRLAKDRFRAGSKTSRTLGAFDCVEAPCTDECPVDQEVPRYMRAVRDGHLDEAVAITRDANPIPSILGRICDRKCQNTCIRTHLDEPLAIREMKRFIMSHETEATVPEKAPDRGVRVAIVGAGPCGLATARELATAGYACTVFEQYEKAGGMVSGTIPTYRLPQQYIDQDVAIVERLGVELRYGQKAGRDFTLSGLREDGFEHVVLAVGAQVGRRLGLPGDDAEGVIDAITFLREVRDGKTPALGRHIGVIGAGDVAMDAARTAFRLSDGKVSLIYRRTVAEMPADPEEIEGLLEEGIEVHELVAPESLVIQDGKLAGLVAQKMELGPKGPDGRRRPVPVEGAKLTFDTDMLLLAVSQHTVLDFFDAVTPEITRWNTIAADPTTLETSVPGVFTGGDVAIDGPASAVKAAGDGKRIAREIRRRVEGPAADERVILETPDLRELVGRRSRREPRVELTHTPPEARKSFDEVLLTMSEDTAREEAARCLDCDTVCSLCVSVCPNRAFFTYVARPFEAKLPAYTVSGGALTERLGQTFRLNQAPQVAVLADFCNECGNCATFCPTAGRPYVDKPRLYVDGTEFLAEQDNAFRWIRGGDVLEVQGRFGGETHRLVRGETLEYLSPSLSARFDPETFAVLQATAAGGAQEGAELSLLPAATLFSILEGLRLSMPFLPGAEVPDAAAQADAPAA